MKDKSESDLAAVWRLAMAAVRKGCPATATLLIVGLPWAMRLRRQVRVDESAGVADMSPFLYTLR